MSNEIDLFTMADQNSTNLNGCYEQLRANCEAQCNTRTLDVCKNLVQDEWRISLNMSLDALHNFCYLTERYKNVYRLKKDQAEELVKLMQSEIPIDVGLAIKKHLGRYSKSRTVFDQTFKDGKNFTSGALNIGGMGLLEYGRFCVVLQRNQIEAYSSVAFIKNESLDYVEDNGVDYNKLSQDLANREFVPLLTLLKHEEDIDAKRPIEEWPYRICCDARFIEAITKDEILNSHIESVRISRKDYEQYLKYKNKVYISEAKRDERLQLELFEAIQKYCKMKKIELKVIEDDGS